ncbi:MAG: MBL fold metallo-hydrolase [Pseudomonadota bacterium]
MKIRILGCGPSGGVPLVGNVWGNCDPENPKNRRLRTSTLVTHRGKNILIDTSPDLRRQLLDAGVTRIDAVLYTHDHADHTHGIDELRPLYFGNRKNSIQVYGNQATIDRIQRKFKYLFDPKEDELSRDLYPNILQANVIGAKSFDLFGLSIQPFLQDHGYSRSLGFRIGDMAYSTDVVRLDEDAFKVLQGVKLWLVDCLAETPRRTHSHLEQTLKWIERVGPGRAILIHMNQELDYEVLKGKLPEGIEPAFDGMEIEVLNK